MLVLDLGSLFIVFNEFEYVFLIGCIDSLNQ